MRTAWESKHRPLGRTGLPVRRCAVTGGASGFRGPAMSARQSAMAAQGALLEAKCGCGGSGTSGKCEECRNQRRGRLQRKVILPGDPPCTGHHLLFHPLNRRLEVGL
jgi:hypothetical protein